jgi:outer membrane protein OmpA-like peptidoglycan-associated protein
VTGSSNAGWGRLALGVVWLLIVLAGVGLGWKLSRLSNVADAPGETVAPSVKPAEMEVTDPERQEVLKRIDLMPNLSSANKERLYAYVERAQQIKRVMSVSFQNGGVHLTEAAIRKIVEESQKAEFAEQARDPVMVFVVLGFADKSGDEKTNLKTSHDRAEYVADLLHKRCSVSNVVQTVPMGGSELFHAQAAAENRVAEVWAILP